MIFDSARWLTDALVLFRFMERSNPSHTAMPQRLTGTEIARRLGISQATVSRALADNPRISLEVREKVQELARTLNYVTNASARTLARGRSHVVGILSGGLHIERTSLEVIALDQALRSRGFLPYIFYTRSETDRIVENIRHLVEHNVEGVIILGVTPGSAESPQCRAVIAKLPIVFVDSILAGSGVHHLIHDYAAAYAEVGRLLEERGTRSPLAIREAPRTSDEGRQPRDSRRLGMQTALTLWGGAERVITLDLAFRPSVLSPQSNSHAALRERLSALLEDHADCDALVCESDEIAITVITLLQSRGKRIPHDIAVVGFDNDQLGERIEPPLTTVAPQPVRMAERAVERLMDLIARPDAPARQDSIPGQLIRRKTL